MPISVKLIVKAQKEYFQWRKDRPELAKKVDELIESIEEYPFKGIGKPEPLKHGLKGFWSRRVTEKHRMIYEVQGELVYVHRCAEHYELINFGAACAAPSP
jgi:toxin YoeB